MASCIIFRARANGKGLGAKFGQKPAEIDETKTVDLSFLVFVTMTQFVVIRGTVRGRHTNQRPAFVLAFTCAPFVQVFA